MMTAGKQVAMLDNKHPTYVNGKRTTGKILSKRTAFETCTTPIVQSLIALYFTLSTENYTALPIVALASSLLRASFATSFGLKLDKSTVFVACLFLYRFFGILVRVMIFALYSTYIYATPLSCS
jgi:hypothetical protein